MAVRAESWRPALWLADAQGFGGHSPTACRAFYWRTSFLTCQWRAVCCCNLWKAFPGEQRQLAANSAVCAAGIFFALSNGRGCAARNSIRRGADFMLCFASFATVLSLGGPQATTIEKLALSQALQLLISDPARAAMLAVIQMVCCTALVLLKPTAEQAVRRR